ncbi:MAG: HAMP domain-containing histidine kinase [Ktedonobacterales bacterium]|nr:HAMP domain-containing histidine kinase [Ktedonobacterales bacterium]
MITRGRAWLARWRGGAGSEADQHFVASRKRLVVLNLSVVSAIVVLMALAVYVTEAHFIDRQLDQQIVSWAHHEPPPHYFMEQQNLATQSANDDGGNRPDFAPLYQPTTPNVFCVAIDPTGHIVLDPTHIGHYGLPDVALATQVMHAGTAAKFTTVTKGAHSFRLYTLVVVNDNGVMVGVLQSGISLDARNAQLGDLLRTLLIVGLGVLALTAGASLLLADKALVPTRQAFARQQRFVAAASHELRTPLALIRSQAELIARRVHGAHTSRRALSPADSATVDDDTHEILSEVDYMSRLLSDLLVLARSPGERQSILHTPVDVRTIAADLVAKTHLLPSTHDRKLRLDAPASPVWVMGDADRLRQFILILLDNALQYTPAGGEVRLRVSTDGDWHHGRARISVADTGVGIAPEHMERIFEPFFRADPARARADGRANAGLGLTLAHWIADAHGGNLTVTSTPGQGTTFTLDLPQTAPNSQHTSPAVPPQQRPVGRHA